MDGGAKPRQQAWDDIITSSNSKLNTYLYFLVLLVVSLQPAIAPVALAIINITTYSVCSSSLQ